MLLTLLVFLVVLSALVLIHELGHFIVAKKFGIKVEEFGFGFPPRVWGKKKGETLYSINLLPIGGFVKLYGEDDAGGGKIGKNKSAVAGHVKDINRAFFARPAWQRALVVVAGVIMNLFLAIAIFYVYLFISGFKTEVPLLGNYKFFGVNQKNVVNVVSFVEKGSPADRAGIRPPFKITAVNGRMLGSDDNVINIIKKNAGQPVSIDGQNMLTYKPRSFSLTPRVNPPKGQGPIGVALDPIAELSYATPSQKLWSGVVHPINMMSYNLYAMKQLINFSVRTGDLGAVRQGFSGPVGIYRIVDSFVRIPNLRESVLQLLNLAGIMSISLAFFNILPIPALDGGRFFFIIIELLTGRKLAARYESIIHAVGFAVLIGLIFLITINDISNIFTGFGR